MTAAGDDIRFEPTTDAAAAAATFTALAIKLAAIALREQPAEHRARIMQDVDAGTCSLAVQCDLPSGTVTTIADHAGGVSSLLLRIESNTPEPQPLAVAARALVNHGLLTVAPDARRRLLGALDDGSASVAVLASLPDGSLRVLAHGTWWSEPRELLRVELPDAPAVVPS